MLCQSVIPPVIKEEIHLTPCPCLPAWANCILTLDWISLQWTGLDRNSETRINKTRTRKSKMQ